MLNSIYVYIESRWENDIFLTLLLQRVQHNVYNI